MKYNKIEIYTFRIDEYKIAFTYFDETYISLEEYDDSVPSSVRKNGSAYLENDVWIWEYENFSEDYQDLGNKILDFITKSGLPV